LSPFHPHSPWTLEREERLKALLPQRLTATAMGFELGVTKNSIISIIHRRGWLYLWNKAPRPVAQYPAPPAAKAPLPLPPPKPKHPRFLDRRSHECCDILNSGAPIEELLVCGAPIPENSSRAFCAAHLHRYSIPSHRRSEMHLERLDAFA
jgi:hypothetical protein